MSLLPSLILGRFQAIERRGLLIWLAASLFLLILRLWLANPFWKSGLTKWTEFPTKLNSSAKFLFQYEYKIHLGFTTLDFPFPETMALISGYTEIVFPVMLVLGIFTRFAALGILGSTIIIQFVYPSAWMIHGSWAITALILVYAGGGFAAVDTALRKLLGMRIGK